MLSLALLALWTPGDVVGGLRAGETAVVLGPNESLAEEQPFTYLRPRVLDATTGVPLANVCLEAWTESGQKGIGAEVCVDRTLTQRDGTARLRARLGSAAAEKVRVSCPGHASRTISVSDTFDDVLLYELVPLEGRVLDFEDHPVVNAIVRTRETCSHAIPASQTRTDAFGRFRLEDCPSEAGEPELEVIGEFTQPLFQLDIGRLRSRQALYGELVLRVARRAPLQLRVVDRTGAPMLGRRVLQRHVPMSEAWTDTEGRCTLPPPADGRDQTLYLNDVGDEVALTSGQFPVGLVSTVCPYDAYESKPTGCLRVELEGAEAIDEDLSAWVFDERGNIEGSGQDNDVRVVPGSVRVVFGAPFSGWRTVVRDVVVGDERLIVRITPEREPVLRVKLPVEAIPANIALQAGFDSISRSLDLGEFADFVQSVPPDVPLTVRIETLAGEVRQVVHPPIRSDLVVDLSVDSTLIRARVEPDGLPLGRVRCTVTDSLGGALPGLRGELTVGGISTYDVTFEGAGPFSWALPAKLPYRLRLDADGYRTVQAEGLVPVPDGPIVVREFVLLRRAHLELRGEIDAIDVGGPEPEVVEGGFDLEAAPGPLTLRIGRTGLPPIALDLVLAEGETRRIDVH